MRPSFMATLNVSSVSVTSVTLSSAPSAKIPMPSLQQLFLILHYDPIYYPEFMCTKAKITRQGNRIQPILCREFIPVHMYVGRFIRFVTVEIKSIRSGTKHCRHAAAL